MSIIHTSLSVEIPEAQPGSYRVAGAVETIVREAEAKIREHLADAKVTGIIEVGQRTTRRHEKKAQAAASTANAGPAVSAPKKPAE